MYKFSANPQWTNEAKGMQKILATTGTTVLIRPTLLVTRHRHLRREEISRTSCVPTSSEEQDKKKSPAGRLNNTKKGDFWCRRDEIFVPSRVLLDFEEFPISSKASRVTWHEELVGIVQYQPLDRTLYSYNSLAFHQEKRIWHKLKSSYKGGKNSSPMTNWDISTNSQA